MAKSDMPPVPPEQHSNKGPGAAPEGGQSDIARPVDKRDRNLEQQGRQGNIHQNTHHQGYQQDR
jgi:hypothetical protein